MRLGLAALRHGGVRRNLCARRARLGPLNEFEYGLLALMISKIEVIDAACIGCGTCWVACPQAFKEHDSRGRP
ncbi:ferredoxin [Thiocapsa marina]|uniref:ferredoxin n=1 Tax=Thiocapsa marina TaxID=244573 RepID=UPI002D21C9C3|nr:ferredoxin [Thiocapsa marina]